MKDLTLFLKELSLNNLDDIQQLQRKYHHNNPGVAPFGPDDLPWSMFSESSLPPLETPTAAGADAANVPANAEEVPEPVYTPLIGSTLPWLQPLIRELAGEQDRAQDT